MGTKTKEALRGTYYRIGGFAAMPEVNIICGRNAQSTPLKPPTAAGQPRLDEKFFFAEITKQHCVARTDREMNFQAKGPPVRLSLQSCRLVRIAEKPY
ncbi:hypothetical protein [Sinorhizobium fredii]|uniref:hypothetical protein n=1 Tax=Rhizobium fredii TaxID=380 RepID=UPI0011D27205|nr:hypothetical protein [Sinorhizobium fredii]